MTLRNQTCTIAKVSASKCCSLSSPTGTCGRYTRSASFTWVRRSRFSVRSANALANSLRSPGHTAADVLDAFSPPAGLRHDGDQSAYHPFHGHRRSDPSARGIFQRVGKQPCCGDNSPAIVGVATPHRVVHVQLANVKLGLLRGRHAHNWLPICTPRSSRLGFVEFI